MTKATKNLTREQKPFRVVWEIQVDATDHKRAAELALTILRDSNSTATVFGVSCLKRNYRRFRSTNGIETVEVNLTDSGDDDSRREYDEHHKRTKSYKGLKKQGASHAD